MTLPLATFLSTASALGSAIAAGLSLLSSRRSNEASRAANRTADPLAAIEHDRWHRELTPQIQLAFVPETSVLRVKPTGPIGLDRLDEVSVTVQNEAGVDHTGHSHLGGADPGRARSGRVVTAAPEARSEWGRSARPGLGNVRVGDRRPPAARDGAEPRPALEHRAATTLSAMNEIPPAGP